MDNLSLQSDEIEVLKSIFGDQWEVDVDTGSYSIQIVTDVKLFITLIPEYPSSAPPKYELLAPTLTGAQKDHIKDSFQHIYESECGNPIIFQWIEKVKEIVSRPLPTKKRLCDDRSDPLLIITEDKIDPPVRKLVNVTHGPTIVDRKSVFQGHACAVSNEKDAQNFINYLLENKKIAQATHNISAYRILLKNSGIVQDCNDDGETHASSRILHLLQILKLTNVMVVVSRWYGGTHLGPDRFKHINNAARQVLLQGGFI